MIKPRRTKGRLRAGEERYRRFMSMLTDAVLMHCGGKCVFANAAAARLFGAASPKEMLGLDVLDLPHPDFREFVQQRINLAYGGELEKLQEIKILRLDGHPAEVEIMALAITYQGLPALQMVLREKTFLRLGEEVHRECDNRLSQVTARLQALENLTAGVSHDLNNAIMAILGNIDLAAMATSDGKELWNRLAAVEQGCYQAKEMVKQLETFAKGGTPPKKPQDLVKILKESARQTVTCSQACVEFSLPEICGRLRRTWGRCIRHSAISSSMRPKPCPPEA